MSYKMKNLIAKIKNIHANSEHNVDVRDITIEVGGKTFNLIVAYYTRKTLKLINVESVYMDNDIDCIDIFYLLDENVIDEIEETLFNLDTLE